MPVHKTPKVSSTWMAAEAALKKLQKQEGAPVCLHRLIEKSCPQDCDSPNTIPGADHCTEWRRGRQTKVIVSQPYGLGLKQLKEMVALCECYGLETWISAWSSWHFAGATLNVEYRRPKSQPSAKTPSVKDNDNP